MNWVRLLSIGSAVLFFCTILIWILLVVLTKIILHFKNKKNM